MPIGMITLRILNQSPNEKKINHTDVCLTYVYAVPTPFSIATIIVVSILTWNNALYDPQIVVLYLGVLCIRSRLFVKSPATHEIYS